MKLFNTEQIKGCDQNTLTNDGITSVELMERAATACFNWIKTKFSRDHEFCIFCGTGNNGGDGLALTRLLVREGFKAKAYLLQLTDVLSEDAAQNKTNLEKFSQALVLLEQDSALPQISNKAILIDAIFGTGINRPVHGWAERVIRQLNDLPNLKIAIDMPSGLPVETLPPKEATVFQATTTLTFQLMKRSFLHKEGAAATGKVVVLDIGLNKEFIKNTVTFNHLTEIGLVRSIFKPRKPYTHKGDYGKAALVGGSYGMMGSIALSCMAALRTGAGRVWIYGPECGYIIGQTLCPEAMYVRCGENFVEKMSIPADITVGIGPGLEKSAITKRVLIQYLNQATDPVVLDADGLNLLGSLNEDNLKYIPQNSILTPHLGEFQRLFGSVSDSMEAISKGVEMASKLKLIIILKGHHTAVILPNGHCFYNPTGNSGMATGGSGDVLTGILTALLAQNYNPVEASILGVWIHGAAGDLAASEIGREAMTSRDITNYLGKAFQLLYPRVD